MSGSNLTGFYQYPGRAAREVAQLTLHDAAVTLHVDAGSQTWPLAELTVSDALGDIPLSLTFADGGRFVPADDSLFRQWYFRHRRPGLIHQLEQHKRSVLAMLFGSVLAGVFYVWCLLPLLSNLIAQQLPVSIEQQLGRYSATYLESQGLTQSKLSATRQQQLQTLFREVIPKDMRDRPGLRLRIMHFPMGANAFMLPDGTLILSDQLVQLAKSDDALAAVMLHETGHYRYRHSMQMVVRSSLISITMMWVMGDVSGVGDTLLQSAVLLNEMRFSRSMESEADEFALEEMQRQGRSLTAMLQIFTALGEDGKEESKWALPDWLSTHPAMEERLEAIRNAAQ
ncbi:M48 family metallopeptidase [Enterobacter sp.]|uniref:M48 family metallopeptidase n=1 Tax=Enterobacter sp. TaxID=42895 RepID=UPI00296FDE2F|nr:M48 family metallopeptidase [Enterobacter sp.]